MLAVQMCDPETNQEYLKGKPYTSCGDLAAYYRIQVAANEEGTASVAITESMIQMWGYHKRNSFIKMRCRQQTQGVLSAFMTWKKSWQKVSSL